MSFQVRMRRNFQHQLRRWNLPAEVQIDVRLRLDALEHNPADRLQRIDDPFEGMAYTFPVVDRSNRAYGYVFTFHIRYGADEQTIWVVSGGYERVPV